MRELPVEAAVLENGGLWFARSGAKLVRRYPQGDDERRASRRRLVEEVNRVIAEVPGANQVLLGAPGAPGDVGSVSVLTMGETNEVTPFEAITTGERFGLGVAAAKLAGGDASDFVVALVMKGLRPD